MKTVTTREVQHHFAKVLELVEAGEEVVITRRGEKVAKLVLVDDEINPLDTKVDWAEAIRHRDEVLGDLPRYEGSLMEDLRVGERY